MTVEIISRSKIATEVWGQVGIKLATPDSLVGLATNRATMEW